MNLFVSIDESLYNYFRNKNMFFETKIQDVLDWSHSRNIINGSTPKDQYIKSVSEMGELGDGLLKNNREEVEDAIGDILVCLINLAEMLDTSLPFCLDKAYNVIKDRKGIVFNGVFVKEGDANYERIVKHVRGNSVSEYVRGDINEIK